MTTYSLVILLAFISVGSAQQAVWGQCGGIGWTGPTTCVAGTFCSYQNDWYSQCVPGTSTTGPTQPPQSATTTTTSGPAPSGSGLNAAAKAAGKLYFGTAVDGPGLNDQPYLAVLRNSADFGQITAANAMKWDATEPSRNSFNFNNGNQIVNLADQNGQMLRGHTCVWHSQLPSWVSNGGFDSATLSSIVQNHCSRVVDAWDVVNEVLNEDGSMRSSVFYNTMGTNFINIAFNAARQADPNTKLYINDYNIEGFGSKTTGMVNLVRQLKNAGVPIQGVGLQAHFIVGSLPGSLVQTMQQYADLGVEVRSPTNSRFRPGNNMDELAQIAITELDIRMTLPADSTKLQTQRNDYQTVIAACKQVSACVGVTLWDFTDKYSWVPNTFSGQGAACPWDENLNKKPAYEGILAGWNSATLLPPIPLYRGILRAHRNLPIEMRALGDDYVKAEFRRHKSIDNPLYIMGFLSQWKMYLDEMPKDKETAERWKGRKLDPTVFEKMSNEQMGQLYELMHATKVIWKSPTQLEAEAEEEEEKANGRGEER
ncbi:hypothetical protein ACEPAF_8669 [Sanghuangporus sanghuang]